MRRMQRNATPVVRVRKDALAAQLDKLGLDSRAAQARAVGISQWTLSRLMSDESDTPGGSIIARLLVAFPGQAFDDLFEVVDADTGKPLRPPLRRAA